MISQRMHARVGSGETQNGTWVAAGAIDDEGTAEITNTKITDQSDGTALVEATHVLKSGSDSAQLIELTSRTVLQPYPGAKHRVRVEGNWRLTSGTKAYSNLRARGKLYATVTDRAVPQGVDREITLVRDGSAEFE